MDQLLSAIAIVSDPTQDRYLQAQAIDYLNTIRTSPEQSWQLALSLFVDAKPDGSKAHNSQTRAFALQIIDDLLNNIAEAPDQPANETLRDAFKLYIRSEYGIGTAESQAPFIRNKFSHTLALLFISSYPAQWPDFFANFYELLQTRSPSEDPSLTAFNAHASTLFLRVLIEISGEVADTILKGAREFTNQRHRRDAAVRDHIRERDSKTISDAVLAIISDNESHLVAVRSGTENGNVVVMEELIALAIRAFAGLIPWININFTVTPDTLPLLFRLLSDPSQNIRVETANVFLRMVLKGLKEPEDKIQLIRVLSLREVLASIEEQTRGHEDNTLFREGLGKVANGLGLELCKLVEDGALTQDLRAISQQLLSELLPVVLRFLADEWDETSQTVHPLISTVLGNHKRAKKAGPHTHMTAEKRQFISSLLDVSLQKMRWDSETDVDDLDDDDRTAFEQMRKDLRTFMESILNIDEELVNSCVQTLTLNTLQTCQNGGAISWQEVELAVHLVYLYGELQRGVKGVSQFVQIPPELGRELKSNLPNAKKPKLNYPDYPLTAHGQLMMALIQSNVYRHSHPFVIAHFFEAIGRYGEFFRARKECIGPVLDAFIGSKGIHNERANLRGRLFYLFHKFIRDIRMEIPTEIVTAILSSIGDLLVLNVDLPDEDSPQGDLLEVAVNTPTLFDSQIYLFETVGTLLSLLGNKPDEQLTLLQMITAPLLASLEESLQAQMLGPQDVLPVLKVHHLIRALGNISKGFPDAPVPTPQHYIVPRWVSVFDSVGDAIMVSLSRMSQFKIVREASRFSFARIIAAAGPATTKFIPPLMASMIDSCKPDELADFINFLGLIVHKLQLEVYDVLDEMTAPLYHHIANLLAKPIDGTDARRENVQTKKAYLEVLVSIMTGRLFVVFVSERNKGLVEPVCQLVLGIARDSSDPPSQKVAWTLLARFTTHFGKTPAQFETTSAERSAANLPVEEYHPIPGYEGFIYEHLIPLAFELPNQSGINIKDGQALAVLGEVGTLIVATRKARGQEVITYFSNVFLPSKGWPQDAIATFIEQLASQDTKGFKKYWTDFVRRSLTGPPR